MPHFTVARWDGLGSTQRMELGFSTQRRECLTLINDPCPVRPLRPFPRIRLPGEYQKAKIDESSGGELDAPGLSFNVALTIK